jgi:hypothetical protein
LSAPEVVQFLRSAKPRIANAYRFSLAIHGFLDALSAHRKQVAGNKRTDGHKNDQANGREYFDNAVFVHTAF